MQNLTISGRVGSVESQYVDTILVCNFSVAVEVFKQGNIKTLWYKVAAWEELAEHCQRYLKKGCFVVVSAKTFLPEAYLDRTGSPRMALNINAKCIEFSSKKKINYT